MNTTPDNPTAAGTVMVSLWQRNFIGFAPNATSTGRSAAAARRNTSRTQTTAPDRFFLPRRLFTPPSRIRRAFLRSALRFTDREPTGSLFRKRQRTCLMQQSRSKRFERFRYAKRDVQRGDVIEMSPRDARLMSAVRNVRAVEAEPQSTTGDGRRIPAARHARRRAGTRHPDIQARPRSAAESGSGARAGSGAARSASARTDAGTSARAVATARHRQRAGARGERQAVKRRSKSRARQSAMAVWHAKQFPQALTTANSRGWFPMYVHEPFTGAWQRNIALSNDLVEAFYAVYACKSLIANDIGKLGLQLRERLSPGAIWQEASSPAFSPVLRKPNHYQVRQQFIVLLDAVAAELRQHLRPQAARRAARGDGDVRARSEARAPARCAGRWCGVLSTRRR